jgi:hypothetical protein
VPIFSYWLAHVRIPLSRWPIFLALLAGLAMLAAVGLPRESLPKWLRELAHGTYNTDEQHRRNGEL